MPMIAAMSVERGWRTLPMTVAKSTARSRKDMPTIAIMSIARGRWSLLLTFAVSIDWGRKTTPMIAVMGVARGRRTLAKPAVTTPATRRTINDKNVVKTTRRN